jgi:hypothetical protein
MAYSSQIFELVYLLLGKKVLGRAGKRTKT